MSKSVITLITSAAAISLLSACSQTPPPLDMANPAAKYCIAVKGTLEQITNDQGTITMCNLPNGQQVEQWQLFRRDHQAH